MNNKEFDDLKKDLNTPFDFLLCLNLSQKLVLVSPKATVVGSVNSPLACFE